MDPEVQEVLGPFLSDSLSWARFFVEAERLAAMDADELVRLQAALVEAVVAGRYQADRPTGPVTFLDEDGSVPGGIAFGRVVSHDDDLPHALADLDDLRAAKGERGARRWVSEVATDEGGGHQGHILLLTVLPRAYRLRTGTAMPGYRAYRQEESRAPGARWRTCTTVLEVEHDGVPGLIAFETSSSSDFELEDGLARDIEALRALVPFVERARHRHALPRGRRDGLVLFRGAVDASGTDDVWVRSARAAMQRPARKPRELPADEVWATIESGPADALPETLERRTPAEIRAFDAGLLTLLAALDTPTLRAAASRALGWLSDDAWEDVRLGVIAQGRAAHTAAVQDPGGFDWGSVEPMEALRWAASEALEARTGERIEPDLPTSGSGVVVVSRRDDELCLRRWADATTARDRHLAAEGDGAAVLAVRADLDRSRLRPAVAGVVPGPLL